MDDLMRRLARIFHAAAERYAAKGTIKGNLRVPDLTEDERLALTGLLGEYVKTRPGEELVLPLTKLDGAVRQRSLGEGLVEVAATLEGRPIQTRAEQRAEAADRWNWLLQSGWLAGSGRAAIWRERLVAGESSALALLQREFNQQERSGDRGHRALGQALEAVTLALDHLPVDQGQTLRLPVFANRFTGDPHGFDEDLFAGRLLLRALTDLIGTSCGVDSPPDDSTERGILLAAAGLLPDGISSYVACFGIASAQRGTRPDLQVGAVREEAGVLLGSLRQVTTWTDLTLSGPTLYAVENPPVFEELVDSLQRAGLQRPLVCTSGFLSVAAYRVLDLAVAGGATIAYGGDFDPNGLTIAAKLIRRYGEKIRLWGMAVADYQQAAGHPKARRFSPEELQKLASHAATPLDSLSVAMMARKQAAYQEALLDQLRQELLDGPGGSASAAGAHR